MSEKEEEESGSNQRPMTKGSSSGGSQGNGSSSSGRRGGGAAGRGGGRRRQQQRNHHRRSSKPKGPKNQQQPQQQQQQQQQQHKEEEIPLQAQQQQQLNGGGSNHRNNNNNNRRQRPRQGRQQQTTGSSANGQQQQQQQQQQGASSNKKNEKQPQKKKKKNTYPPHKTLEECLQAYYHHASTLTNHHHQNHREDPQESHVEMVRGTLRVLPFSNTAAATTASFVTCDRGLYDRDICIPTEYDRNRALHGDVVFCELVAPEEEENAHDDDDAKADDSTEQAKEEEEGDQKMPATSAHLLEQLTMQDENDNDDDRSNDDDDNKAEETWQDDPIQAGLWNPVVSIPRPKPRRLGPKEDHHHQQQQQPRQQRQGRVVAIVPPKEVHSEVTPSQKQRPTRRIVGTLKVLPDRSNHQKSSSSGAATAAAGGGGGTILLTPNNRSLPQFKCPAEATRRLIQQMQDEHRHEKGNHDVFDLDQVYVSAEYVYGSWQPSHKWPPCTRVQRLGTAFDLEDEIQALLAEHGVHHGDHFAPAVLKNVQDAVQSGVYYSDHHNDAPQKPPPPAAAATATSSNNDSTTTATTTAAAAAPELGWKPTPDMYQNRRDYRTSRRIFTIDPTTAKDLDDALHIHPLPDGTIEVGVHIADVSYFVQPQSAVDEQAQYRSTTVYLVDRTIPMLPRPLCEVACSLNENVERLAFSCVWKMNPDGTLYRRRRGSNNQSKTSNGGNGEEEEEADVWYGRTVIKSCARLDYATAQNIIENKVATGEAVEDMDETLWPAARRPTAGTQHTVDEVATDVRLMHRVAMARRRLRFCNGALGLHGTKLTFQLDNDGQTPLLTAPYPIRDSNRLVEEFMLLANYLVAQRLITHAADRAVLRCHKEPLEDGLDQLAAVAKAAIGFEMDITSSQALHDSLVRLGRECQDSHHGGDALVLKCITQLLMTPMVPADYFAAGTVEPPLWRHFALNIPYYTHFTSPIRRYPDVMVHRLLQATIDGPEAVDNFYMDVKQIQKQCEHSNEKRMASKKAQERCDRVFLSLFVRAHPIHEQLGVVLSVGKSSAFTVFVPSLGVSAILYLDEHKDMLTFAADDDDKESGTRRILLQQKPNTKQQQQQHDINKWGTLEIKIFTKIQVTVLCKDKLRLEGPWRE